MKRKERMVGNISLEGLNKAEVLAALYNASKPLGMGFLHYNPTPMTTEEAEVLLESRTYFDYLNGRVMKIDLSDDELDPWLYDRDNGQGAALRAIEAMMAGNTAAIQEAHTAGIRAARDKAKELILQETDMQNGHVILGMADVANVIAPILDAIDD